MHREGQGINESFPVLSSVQRNQPQPQNLPIPLGVEHTDSELGAPIWSLLVELNEHVYK